MSGNTLIERLRRHGPNVQRAQLPRAAASIFEAADALEKCRRIIERERKILVDGYTNLSGPSKGEITDPQAKAEIAEMDDALSSIQGDKR